MSYFIPGISYKTDLCEVFKVLSRTNGSVLLTNGKRSFRKYTLFIGDCEIIKGGRFYHGFHTFLSSDNEVKR